MVSTAVSTSASSSGRARGHPDILRKHQTRLELRLQVNEDGDHRVVTERSVDAQGGRPDAWSSARVRPECGEVLCLPAIRAERTSGQSFRLNRTRPLRSQTTTFPYASAIASSSVLGDGVAERRDNNHDDGNQSCEDG